MEVRVRFAPSPTGYLHIGGARTALFNWLYARGQSGTFILRIEDTDAERSSEDMVEGILEGLTWLGLHWDEGPYFQSQRLALYRQTAARLLHDGKAYRCFCPADAERASDETKPDPCRDLDEEAVRSWVQHGRDSALRFKVPRNRSVTFQDEVFGQVSVQSEHIPDFIILRSDETPTYHLSVVSDDVDMGITHVIRGADHLSNTTKHVLLFEALEASLPRFAHLPLILGPDKKRLSKRHGATSVTEYRKQGFLAEAVRNYLALLGWSPGDDQEFFSEDELIRRFHLERINKANAVFDVQKLEWMNGKFLSGAETESLETGVREALEREGIWKDSWSADDRPWFLGTIDLLKKGARKFTDFTDLGRAFFSDSFPMDPEAVDRYLNPEDAETRNRLKEALEELSSAYETLEPFDLQSTEQVLREIANRHSIKAGQFIGAVRVGLTGKAHAPGIFDVVLSIGRPRVVDRLRRSINMLDDPTHLEYRKQ